MYAERTCCPISFDYLYESSLWAVGFEHNMQLSVYSIFSKMHSNVKSHANICSAYRTDDAKPIVLPVVRAVEAQMAADQTLNKEYLPVPGLPDYRSAATKLLLGADSPAIAENRVRLQEF